MPNHFAMTNPVIATMIIHHAISGVSVSVAAYPIVICIVVYADAKNIIARNSRSILRLPFFAEEAFIFLLTSNFTSRKTT